MEATDEPGTRPDDLPDRSDRQATSADSPDRSVLQLLQIGRFSYFSRSVRISTSFFAAASADSLSKYATATVFLSAHAQIAAG